MAAPASSWLSSLLSGCPCLRHHSRHRCRLAWRRFQQLQRLHRRRRLPRHHHHYPLQRSQLVSWSITSSHVLLLCFDLWLTGTSIKRLLTRCRTCVTSRTTCSALVEWRCRRDDIIIIIIQHLYSAINQWMQSCSKWSWHGVWISSPNVHRSIKKNSSIDLPELRKGANLFAWKLNECWRGWRPRSIVGQWEWRHLWIQISASTVSMCL